MESPGISYLNLKFFKSKNAYLLIALSLICLSFLSFLSTASIDLNVLDDNNYKQFVLFV